VACPNFATAALWLFGAGGIFVSTILSSRAGSENCRRRKFTASRTPGRLADAGHYVLDDARDEVVPLICSFLA
jgi:hypothetical protein